MSDEPGAAIELSGEARTALRSVLALLAEERPAPSAVRIDISRARGEIGYDPKIGLREGITRTLDWYREHGWV